MTLTDVRVSPDERDGELRTHEAESETNETRRFVRELSDVFREVLVMVRGLSP